MYNILAISPISIAGSLIIKGLSKGFQQLGNNILYLDIRELNFEIIKKFKPDFVIGYDYVQFINPQAEKILEKLNIPVIHYFADDPNSNFAHSGDLSLFSKLSNSDGIIFCWDKQYLNVFRNKCFYLPLGVDADLYTVQNNNTQQALDIVFTGRPLTNIRLTILSEIIKNFPDKLSIYSYKKHFDTSIEDMQKLLNETELNHYKNSYKGFLETEEQLAEVYANSKIVLNITMDQGLSSMNYRVLEVLAAGGFLLTDYKQDTADYFKADKDLVFYKNNEELIRKISKYLNEHSLRNQIAENGKKMVINNNTFKQRAQEILNKIGELRLI
ncbi:MAG: hypothetical protein A2287_02985 [Candidatus Melainabacteria bacterium RIFOXYA12_FULL_32_12]|nr:MAG: hypothetical protein A2255_06715 [Candidatus Melainabacteria bacterium RIFOXYA2_FULL_32_9]OGI29347.1 MAG: hypothetical protein A2287_02985 [Candidatus Melainabacteria bacterium RIFOXYA12_FULL_32_12]